MLVTPLAASSEEYKDWVALQTLKKDPGPQFWDIDPKKAMKAKTGKVDEMEKVEDVTVEGLHGTKGLHKPQGDTPEPDKSNDIDKPAKDMCKAHADCKLPMLCCGAWFSTNVKEGEGRGE